MGLLRLKVNGEYVTVAQGPAGPIGPAGPQGPQGVPGTSPTTEYDPASGLTAPDQYPIGITYGSVSGPLSGMPSTKSGTLVTIKRSAARVYQEFVETNTGLTAVNRWFRHGYQTGDLTINGWGPWQSLNEGPTLISEQVVSSAVGSVGWTGLSAMPYTQLLLIFDFTPTATLTPLFRFNGLSGASDYTFGKSGYWGGTSAATSTSGSSAIDMSYSSGSAARMFGRVYIDTVACRCHFVVSDAASGYYMSGAGRLKSYADISTIALLASTSTIASGTFRLYGVE